MGQQPEWVSALYHTGRVINEHRHGLQFFEKYDLEGFAQEHFPLAKKFDPFKDTVAPVRVKDALKRSYPEAFAGLDEEQ